MTIKPNDAIDDEDKAEGESTDKRSGAVRTERLRRALSDLFNCIQLIEIGLLAMLAISLVLSPGGHPKCPTCGHSNCSTWLG